MKAKLLQDLAKYPLCWFFLRKCVEDMSDRQITADLAAEPDMSLLQHFDKPDQMAGLEQLFSRTMETFGLSKEDLKRKAEFNFDVYDIRNFESVRAVFRFANALSEVGFTNFVLIVAQGLADFMATRGGQRWFVEVKALVLQTKPQEFEIAGKIGTFTVDKFQPESRNTADYVENVSRLLARRHVPDARQQLLRTVEKMGAGKKMAAIVVNLFLVDFIDPDCLRLVETRLSGKAGGEWGINYLADIDALVFLTNQLYPFPGT